MKKAIKELFRVCKKGGLIYLYVYGKGGIYWDARQKMNKLMKKITKLYSKIFRYYFHASRKINVFR